MHLNSNDQMNAFYFGQKTDKIAGKPEKFARKSQKSWILRNLREFGFHKLDLIKWVHITAFVLGVSVPKGCLCHISGSK